jgi:hypothetical protein
MHKFEIYQRSDKEHRAGAFALMIDGMEAEVTTDPMQFMPKALAAANGDNEKAIQLCAEYAQKSLERRIQRLKSGLMPAAPGLAGSGPESGMDPINRKTEKEAVHAFLNRGRLNGLTKEQRKARKTKRDELLGRDLEAEWKERRMTLIKKAEDHLHEWEEKVNALDPDDQTEEAVSIRSKAERWIRMLKKELEALKPGIVMASHGFQWTYGQYVTKQIDLVNDDIRICKLMTNTTADTQRDAIDHGNDITTPDEFDGSGYTSGGQALDNQAVNIDDGNDRAEFDADDEAATLGAGTRSIQGNLVTSFVTSFALSAVIYWIEYSSNKTPDGSLFTDVFNAEGILQFADG